MVTGQKGVHINTERSESGMFQDIKRKVLELLQWSLNFFWNRLPIDIRLFITCEVLSIFFFFFEHVYNQCLIVYSIKLLISVILLYNIKVL